MKLTNDGFYCLVVESHPDNVHDDLRLDQPFPGFVQFCDSLNLKTMSRKVSHKLCYFIYLQVSSLVMSDAGFNVTLQLNVIQSSQRIVIPQNILTSEMESHCE
jgi:hypothetical protein